MTVHNARTWARRSDMPVIRPARRAGNASYCSARSVAEEIGLTFCAGEACAWQRDWEARAWARKTMRAGEVTVATATGGGASEEQQMGDGASRQKRGEGGTGPGGNAGGSVGPLAVNVTPGCSGPGWQHASRSGCAAWGAGVRGITPRTRRE